MTQASRQSLIIATVLLCPLLAWSEQGRPRCLPGAKNSSLALILRETQQALTMRERIGRIVAPSSAKVIRKRFAGDPVVMDAELASQASVDKVSDATRELRVDNPNDTRTYILNPTHLELRRAQVNSLLHGENVYLHTKKGDRIYGTVVVVREFPRKIGLLTDQPSRASSDAKHNGQFHLLELNWNQIESVTRAVSLHEASVRAAGFVDETKQFGRRAHQTARVALRKKEGPLSSLNRAKAVSAPIEKSGQGTESMQGKYRVKNQQSDALSSLLSNRLQVRKQGPATHGISDATEPFLDLKIPMNEVWEVQLLQSDGLMFITRRPRREITDLVPENEQIPKKQTPLPLGELLYGVKKKTLNLRDRVQIVKRPVKPEHETSAVELWDLSTGRQLASMSESGAEITKVDTYIRKADKGQKGSFVVTLSNGKNIEYEMEESFDWIDI